MNIGDSSDDTSPNASKSAKKQEVSVPKVQSSPSLELVAERRLIRRLQKGDDRAFQEFVNLYQTRVFNLVFRMLGDRQEAEDIAQDVFISVFRHLSRFRGESRLYTWIYRIASNACKNRIKYLRGRQFHRKVELKLESSTTATSPRDQINAALQSNYPSPEDAARNSDLQQRIERALNSLDEDQRLLIVLRDIEGLSYQDIIDVTGLTEGTLKSRLHRARIALKNRLGESK